MSKSRKMQPTVSIYLSCSKQRQFFKDKVRMGHFMYGYCNHCLKLCSTVYMQNACPHFESNVLKYVVNEMISYLNMDFNLPEVMSKQQYNDPQL